MYTASIIIIIGAIVIFIEAGVITNRFGPKFDTSLIDSMHKLEEIDKLSRSSKKYIDVGISPNEINKPYENTHKTSSSKKSWVVKKIPRLSDIEESRIHSMSRVFNNDFIPSEPKTINNRLKVKPLGDQLKNQQTGDDLVVENVELEFYPNVFDQDIKPFGNKYFNDGYQVTTEPVDQISNQQFSNNTFADSNVTEKHIALEILNEDNTTNEMRALTLQNKSETLSKKQINNEKPILTEFLDIHKIIPTKCDDKSDCNEEKRDLNEFIFVDDIENSPESDTESNANYFEMATDIFLDEPRFKRAVNVIEEENLSTTISEFKYTGQHTGLNNYLYFKNINS